MKTLLLLFTASLGFSQSYPPHISLYDVPQEPYASPTGPLPGYLVRDTLTDPRYLGNVLTRISDKVVFGVNTQQLGNNYSKDQAWNSDGTLLKLAGYPAAILDGNTYQFLYWSSIPSYARWSNTHPTTTYGTSGNTFVSHNVITDVRTTLHTFSSFSSVDFGFGEGNQSNDDRYVGLIGRNGSDLTLITYDILNDVVVGTKYLGNAPGLDWFSVSQSGNYAVVDWSPNGNGPTEGVKSYALDFTNEVHVYDETEHADLGYDSYGNEVIVGFGNNNTWGTDHYLFMARLSDGHYTPLFHWQDGTPFRTHSGIWGGHVSMRATNRPGWAYVSEGCCANHPTLPNEIFAIKLDGSDSIERYCNSNNDPTVGYGHEVHNAVNRDGTRMVFKSNYRDAGWKGDVAPPAWVIEVQQGAQPPTANAGSDVTICLGDSVQLTATGGNTYLWNTGATTSSIWVTPSATTTAYWVTVTNVNGSDNDTVKVTTDSTICSRTTCFNPYTIAIDGIKESFWTNSFEDSMGKTIAGTITNANDLSAIYNVMWDNTNLYLIAEITDDIKTNDSPNEWNDDGIEIFIDGNNEKNVVYDANDRQFIIRWNDNTVYEHGYNTATNPSGVTFAQTTTPTGYIVEGAVSWSSLGVTPTNGKNIGFEIQVNDDDNGGTSLEARKSWYALSSPSSNASLMGAIELTANVCNNTTAVLKVDNKGISIYPNPTNDYFVIGNLEDRVYSLSIIDYTGKIVMQKQNKREKQINITHLQKGIYIVNINTSNSNKSIKLIKI